MTEPLKTSVNFKGDLRRRLEWYCESNDLQPSQAVKMFVIEGLRTYLKCPPTDTGDTSMKNTQVSARGQSLARTCVSKDLSLDKSNSPKGDQVEFVKSFIGHCENLKFPERISKEIKSHWSAILDSKLSASELAESYNDYVSDSHKKNSIPSHPNSWIAGHGWLNKTEEIDDEPRGNYDF